MAKQSERLLRNAAGVARRPSQKNWSLIIALIVLLCLSIGAGFAFASQNLDFNQQMTLVGFLILFPCLAVGIAVWLIVRNQKRLAITENDNLINWRIMRPENQRRKLNLEVTELARLLATPPEEFSLLRSGYIVAEDLALRRIENEEKIPLLRHVAIENSEFDAVLVNEDLIKCIEVMFLVSPEIAQPRINVILRKISYVNKLFGKMRGGTKLILMLALVTQLEAGDELKLRSTLSDKLAATPVDVDIRLFDFEELQKIYAEE